MQSKKQGPTASIARHLLGVTCFATEELTALLSSVAKQSHPTDLVTVTVRRVTCRAKQTKSVLIVLVFKILFLTPFFNKLLFYIYHLIILFNLKLKKGLIVQWLEHDAHNVVAAGSTPAKLKKQHKQVLFCTCSQRQHT